MYFLLVHKIIKAKRSRFQVQNLKNAIQQNSILRNIFRFLDKRKDWLKNRTKKERYLFLGIVLLMLGTSGSLLMLPKNIILGFVLGIIILWLFEKVKHDVGRAKRLKEVAILFEGVEMYSKAGYSLLQSLKASKILTRKITSSVDKALARWSVSPKLALETLKEELDLEESDTLILLMMHLEMAGNKNLKGMLQREAHNIERLQRMKTELKIAHRPLILMVYKVLPITAILGIVIGSLLFRMYYMLSGMGLLNTL